MAHQLRGAGLSTVQIAAELGYSDRAVHRWLLTPPPPIPARAPDLSAGLCAQTDPEIFHPEGGKGVIAKKICQRCHLEDACREYAVEHLELSGIWGGTSQSERYALAKKRKQK